MAGGDKGIGLDAVENNVFDTAGRKSVFRILKSAAKSCRGSAADDYGFFTVCAVVAEIFEAILSAENFNRVKKNK